jgi:uncharacterized protein YbjT (DUF2867 family)
MSTKPKILVQGATGQVGKNVISHLIAELIIDGGVRLN